MNKQIKLLTLLSLVSLVPSCVPIANNYTLQQQIDEQNLQIQQLSAQLANIQPAQADSYLQMQSMNQQINMMRGSLDDLEYKVKDVNLHEMQVQIAQHDKALRSAEVQLGVELQLGDSIAMPQSQVPRDAAPLTKNIDVSLEPLPAVLPAVDPDIQALGAVDPSAAQESSTAQLLYDAGIKDFNDRKYANALKSFTDFSNIYENHELISNALFWEGECQYQLKNYPAAAIAYERVIAAHPDSNKVASAYLKQGMTFANLKKKDAAKERYTQLIELFPNSSEATRAKEYLKNYE